MEGTELGADVRCGDNLPLVRLGCSVIGSSTIAWLGLGLCPPLIGPPGDGFGDVGMGVEMVLLALLLPLVGEMLAGKTWALVRFPPEGVSAMAEGELREEAAKAVIEGEHMLIEILGPEVEFIRTNPLFTMLCPPPPPLSVLPCIQDAVMLPSRTRPLPINASDTRFNTSLLLPSLPTPANGISANEAVMLGEGGDCAAEEANCTSREPRAGRE